MRLKKIKFSFKSLNFVVRKQLLPTDVQYVIELCDNVKKTQLQ